ncbi:hypothetical protein H5410_031213 [Solanum commersonii]|uniref:Uncharacterized protein n=1 Tax=Solanum commersonii TaxID=4109 RepID=A0A9J5YGH8_SOLCO|nr:hypothetical protein H5410_031213 [Solanum commersonii]
MAHMEQELEILREELCQVRDLAKLSATTFPTFKMPIYFPKVDLPSADLPNHPEQTQHAPTRSRVPPASPTPVRTVTDLSHRDPAIPTMQHLLGAHVAAPYEPHIPLVYAIGAPTFTTPVVINVPYEYASINAQLHHLRKVLKNLQVTRGTESLDYDDLCIHPDIDMPVRYKPPKFDMFDGQGDPHAHLRVYFGKLVGVGKNKNMRMKLFIRSLFGEALTCRHILIGQHTEEAIREFPRVCMTLED